MAKNLGHAQMCVETTRFAVRRESILMAATGKKVAEKANASKHLQVICNNISSKSNGINSIQHTKI